MLATERGEISSMHLAINFVNNSLVPLYPCCPTPFVFDSRLTLPVSATPGERQLASSGATTITAAYPGCTRCLDVQNLHVIVQCTLGMLMY